ncbi:MAG: CxxxxCH/CxxCH domain-containing protein [Phycisphaerae bacterium]
MISSCCASIICHSRGSRNPAFSLWTPAFAGLTFSIFVFRNRY